MVGGAIAGVLVWLSLAGTLHEETVFGERRFALGSGGKEGEGVSVEFKAGPGFVFLFLESGFASAVLSVGDGSGDLLKSSVEEPGRSPTLGLELEEEQTLWVQLDRRGEPSRVTPVLVILSSSETPETDEFAAEVFAWLRESEALSGRGSVAEAMTASEEFLERVALVPGWSRSLRVGRSLYRLAELLTELGDSRVGRRCLEAALSVVGRLLPPDDEELNSVRVNLAKARYEQSDYAGALELQEEVIRRFGARATARDSEASARVLFNAARLSRGASLNAMKRLVDAREVFEGLLTELGSADELQEEDFLLVANLALTIKGLGDWAGARALEERLVRAASRVLDVDDLFLARARRMLAESLGFFGDEPARLVLAESALEVFERRLPWDHLDVQRARRELALAHSALHSHEMAYEVERLILEECERRGGPQFWLLDAKSMLSSTLGRMGRFEESEKLEREVIEATMAGREIPPYSLRTLLHQRVWGETSAGRIDVAEKSLLDLAACLKARIQKVALALSLREIEAAVDLNRWPIDGILSWTGARLNLATPVLSGVVFELIETHRGVGVLAADLVRQRHLDVGGDDRDFQEFARKLSKAAREGVSKEGLVSRLHEKDKAERRGRLEKGALGVEFPECSPREIGRYLEVDEAAVGFWRYRRYGLGLRGVGQDHFVAFVVRPGCEVLRIELGEATKIEEAVVEWRAWTRGGGKVQGRGVARVEPLGTGGEEKGQELRRLIFDPIKLAIGEAKRLFVAPDEILWTVSLDCLPFEGGILGDQIEVYSVFSLSALLLRDTGEEFDHSFLGVGGIEYGVRKTSKPGGRALVQRSENEGLGTFAPLSNTGEEVRAIRGIFREVEADARRSWVLEGREATRANLFQRAPEVSYLHIATHGYFALGSVPATPGFRIVDTQLGLEVSTSPRDDIRTLAPLLLCGLAFAGANRKGGGLNHRSGVVTGEELRTLSLNKCRLVVLSACETNVGQMQLGQGVQSLQKAFHAAGARMSIGSLGSVRDKATRDLMISFYRRILQDQESVAQAFWKARMEIRRKHGGRDWARWILVGIPERTKVEGADDRERNGEPWDAEGVGNER